MSIYYNFCYVDLNKVKSPCSEDGQMYLLENHESYEYLSNPILFSTMNNHHIRKCFNKVIEVSNEQELIEPLKYVFGNMFWPEIRLVINRKIPYHLNYWKLERYQLGNNDYGGHLDWYSIHHCDISTIIQTINNVNLEQYFNVASKVNNLDTEKDKLNRAVIQDWISMYQIAITKGKGIVYDIG